MGGAARRRRHRRGRDRRAGWRRARARRGPAGEEQRDVGAEAAADDGGMAECRAARCRRRPSAPRRCSRHRGLGPDRAVAGEVEGERPGPASRRVGRARRRASARRARAGMEQRRPAPARSWWRARATWSCVAGGRRGWARRRSEKSSTSSATYAGAARCGRSGRRRRGHELGAGGQVGLDVVRGVVSQPMARSRPEHREHGHAEAGQPPHRPLGATGRSRRGAVGVDLPAPAVGVRAARRRVTR